MGEEKFNLFFSLPRAIFSRGEAPLFLGVREVLVILPSFFGGAAATPRASRVGRADWRLRFGAARARASGSKPARPRHLASCVERSEAARLMS